MNLYHGKTLTTQTLHSLQTLVFLNIRNKTQWINICLLCSLQLWHWRQDYDKLRGSLETTSKMTIWTNNRVDILAFSHFSSTSLMEFPVSWLWKLQKYVHSQHKHIIRITAMEFLVTFCDSWWVFAPPKTIVALVPELFFTLKQMLIFWRKKISNYENNKHNCLFFTCNCLFFHVKK